MSYNRGDQKYLGVGKNTVFPTNSVQTKQNKNALYSKGGPFDLRSKF